MVQFNLALILGKVSTLSLGSERKQKHLILESTRDH